jgi:hypothetical protein
MTSRPACFGVAAFILGCSGTNTGNPVTQKPTLRRLDENIFQILDAAANACDLAHESDPSKLQPPRQDLEARLGDGSAEFIVLMKQEIDSNAYPLPMGRDEDGEDPRFVARATAIATSQACTLEELSELGGTYVHSFLLINAFTAELTVEQAVALSELEDVASVELSQTDEPPPGL